MVNFSLNIFCRFFSSVYSFGVNDSIDSIDELSESESELESDKSGDDDDDDEFLLVVVWECLGVNSELGVLLIENVIGWFIKFHTTTTTTRYRI